GVILSKPSPAPVRIDQAVPQAALQEFADAVAKSSGRSVAAFGQARADGRLWLWLDFGQIAPSAADSSAPGPFGSQAPPIDATRMWSFFTSGDGQQYTVRFFVNRLPNTSLDELNRVIDVAGPVFARILDSLRFEKP